MSRSEQPSSVSPSLKALRAFSIIATEGNFERAASRLNISRSAVSHLIRDLERQLGVQLLVRAGRGTALTADGQILLSAIGDAIQRIDTGVEAFRRDRNQIRLSTVATLATCWLIPRIASLQTRHPHLHLAISTTTRPIDFEAEDIDCGIRHGTGGWPGLDSTFLFKDALTLVGTRDFAAKAQRKQLASALRSIPIIQAHTRPNDLRQWWEGAGLAGPMPKPALIVQNRAQALAAATAGAGITLIDPAYIGGPSPLIGLVTIGQRSVDLADGYFFVVPAKHRGRRNIALVGAWLAAEAQKSAARTR